MKNYLTQPKSAAIVALILSLPILILIGSTLIGYQPSIDPIRRLLGLSPSTPDVLGTSIFAGIFLLLIAALLVASAPVIRAIRRGESLTAEPVNLFLAIAILGIVLAIIGAFVADQYPCWIGVPNCD